MRLLRRRDPVPSGPDEFPVERGAALADAHALLGSYLEEGLASRFGERPKNLPTGRALLEAPQEAQIETALAAAERVTWVLGREAPPGWRDQSLPFQLAAPAPLNGLVKVLLLRRLPWRDDQLASLLDTFSDGIDRHWEWAHWLPMNSVLGAIERSDVDASKGGLRASLLRLVDVLSRPRRGWTGLYAAERRAIERALVLAGESESTAIEADPWTARILRDLAEAPPDARRKLEALVELAASASQAKPSRRFIEQAADLVEVLGGEAARTHLLRWIFAAAEAKGDEQHPVVPPKTGDLLRGLVWTLSPFHDPDAAAAFAALCSAAYTKVPGYGPRSAKAGNACMAALASVPGDRGVAQLSRLRSTLKHPTARRQLEQTLRNAAAQRGITSDELEESTVPDFGLGPDGVRTTAIGEHKAELVLAGSTASLRWLRPDGRRVKTTPAVIKRNAPERVADLRREVKELRPVASAQRARLERLLALDRSWNGSEWRSRYLDHGLVGQLARLLIWRFGALADERSALRVDGRWVDAAGAAAVGPGDEYEVRLWHPIGADVEEIRAWRVLLENRGIRQPFKQAHREVYLLTDAERETRIYSNRFAAHVLRQHQLAALCRERGWSYTLQGAWDSANEPRLSMPQWGLTAAFWVEVPAEGYDEGTGIYPYVLSDQVRFLDDAGEPVPLADVPRLAFTEAMRDVDLFVGVTSIGNDPEWIDRGEERAYDAYWREYSFGELSEQAKTRADILERLLPKLKIANRASIAGRFLAIRGDLRAYRIHLGSGNVLMEPDNRYLCIVPERPERGADRVFLPFEGDRTLALILSKAFMLAADSELEDPVIRAQIARS